MGENLDSIAKTKMIVFGKASLSVSSLACISLHCSSIEFVKTCKYLGFYIVSSTYFKVFFWRGSVRVLWMCKFGVDIYDIPKRKCINSIIVHQLRAKTHIWCSRLSASEKQQLNVAVNNAVRRIFGFRRWESIRYLREFYKFESIEVMFEKAKRNFNTSLMTHSNQILRFLSSLDLVE